MTTIQAGCFDKPCKPWTPPPNCCDACEGEEADALFDAAWEWVTEWLFCETCYAFPGCCPVETEPCPPCECMCDYCDCGPWGVIDLDRAFCHEIKVTEDGVPCLEFVFPQEDGTEKIINATTVDPDTGRKHFKLRPDLLTVDWCVPFKTSGCGSSWPANDHCDPWTIRATLDAEPPKMLLLGAAKFACEIVKDCQGKANCLPDNVRSITRRGLTMDVGEELSETISFDNAGTGIPILDIALRRWGCDAQSLAAHFDPLAKLDEQYRRTWSFRGVLAPTPVSTVPGC